MSDTESSDRPKRLAPLPRAVWLLSFVSFFADVSGEMVYPLLPLFVVGALGSSKTQLGIIEGFSILLVALMTGLAGFRSDRMGKRVPWIRWGYGLPVIGKTVIALATSWQLVLGGRLMDRFGKGLRGAPRDALIAEAVTPDQRGRAFGLHRALDTSGALIGVLLAAFLLWWLTGTPSKMNGEQSISAAVQTPAWVFRAIFAVGAVLGFLSMALAFFVEEADVPTAAIDNSTTNNSSTNAVGLENGADPEKALRPGWLGLPKSYWFILGVLTLFSFANSSDAFLLLRASDLGYSPWVVVLIYAVYNVTYAALAYPAGAMSDRLGRWRIIAVGWAIYAIVYAGFAFLPEAQAWGLWPLMAFYGLYMALTEGVGKALIADHSPRQKRGTAMGIFYSITGLTTLVASLLAGLAWDRFGPTAAFLIGAGFAVIALLAVILFSNRLAGHSAN